MATRAKKEEEVVVEDVVIAEVEEVEEDDNEVHIRLKKAQICIDENLGLNLNALMNRTTAILDKRDLSDIDKQRLRSLVGSKDIEKFDPSLPEPMNIPEYKLDLSDTVEFKFLNDAKTTDKQVMNYVTNALNTPRAARIPLKVLYSLETLGQNKALKPRLPVVEAIVNGLEAIGIAEKDAALTPVEKDKLVDAIEQHTRQVERGVSATMSDESDEVLNSVQ
jgi:hypothetical protein